MMAINSKTKGQFVLRFFWRDPDPDSQKVKSPIEGRVEAADWRHHYAPTLDLVRSHENYFGEMLREPSIPS